ncbi:MAG: vWA domain-containing protein [Pseudomonadota bacterium]
MLSQFPPRFMLGATVSAAAVIAGVMVVAPVVRDTRLPKVVAPPAGPAVQQQAPVAPEPGVGNDTRTAAAEALARTGAAPPAEARKVAPAPLADVARQGVDEYGPAVAATGAATGPAAAPMREETPQAEGDYGAVSGLAAAAPAPRAADAPAFRPETNTEAFPEASPNPVKVAAEDPVSTFSIDMDTASWSVIRSSLMAGSLPPPDAVRIEEMVNYFPYSYPAPDATGAPFRPTVSVMPTPWNTDTELLRIGIQGRMPATEDRPALNLVFLIDTSGSMEDANKLPLLKQALALMLGRLRPEDRVAIVTYAGSAGEVLAPTPAGDRAKIMGALDSLMAGGSTAGQEGIALAYSVAEGMARDGAVSRILLATDGDFNVGISDPGALKDYVAGKRKSGIYLSVLGFGRGNLDDATMQALAQNGNGTAAYVDTLSEAQKVLADQLTGALFPIADDVKVQVEFNPAVVAEYRLIGYETRALRREDFNNDRVDAGEIGAGLQVTALYEVTPVGSPAVLNDAPRYQAWTTGRPLPQQAEELGFLKLRWKEPGAAASGLIERPIPAAAGGGDDDFRFAAAVAGMGQLLTGATYLGDWGWDEAIALANGAKGADPFGYRAEAVQVMRLAQSLVR